MKTHFGDLPPAGGKLLTDRLGIDFTGCSFRAPTWFSAWAYDDDDQFAGIFAVEFPCWFEGKVTLLIIDPACVTRRVMHAMFTALFSQVRRLTAEVEPHNRRALLQVRRLGFQYEGFRRLGLEGTRDTMMFGMLREECRFLPGYVAPSPLIPSGLEARDYERMH